MRAKLDKIDPDHFCSKEEKNARTRNQVTYRIRNDYEILRDKLWVKVGPYEL